MSKKYIQKAGKTKNDTEFMKLIDEYITRLSQTGHANLIYGDPIVNQPLAMSKEEKNNINDTLSFYNIEQSSMDKVNCWFGIYDNKIQKLFIFNPLIVKPQNNVPEWKVSFRPPNNDIEDAVISELYQSNTSTFYQNVITEDLSENIGYIKIFSFPSMGTAASDTDKRLISDYITKSQGKYKKLIIDIRGNRGGDPEYWKTSIVAPLIKKSVVYTQTSAVKKSFFKYWGKTVQQYLDTQYIDTQIQSFINKKNHMYLQEVAEIKNLSGYDDSWITFNVPYKI